MNMLDYGLMLAAQTAQTVQTVQAAPVVQTTSGLDITVLLQSILYAAVGILLLFLGYKIFDWLTPTDAQKKIFQERNTAVAILFGFFILGLSIIIASTIHGW
jgi:putative membrane protein